MSERKTILKTLLNELETDPEQSADTDLDYILYLCRVGCQENAPVSPDRIYRICHAVAKQYGLYPAMRSLMKRRWGAESMREMDLPSLQDLFFYMRGLERLKKRF